MLFASGIPTAEKPTAKKYYLLSNGPNANPDHSEAWTKYKRYLNATSILIPVPPVLYRPLPQLVKRYILLDLPIYHFNDNTDGPAAVEEERRKLL